MDSGFCFLRANFVYKIFLNHFSYIFICLLILSNNVSIEYMNLHRSNSVDKLSEQPESKVSFLTL